MVGQGGCGNLLQDFIDRPGLYAEYVAALGYGLDSYCDIERMWCDAAGLAYE